LVVCLCVQMSVWDVNLAATLPEKRRVVFSNQQSTVQSAGGVWYRTVRRATPLSGSGVDSFEVVIDKMQYGRIYVGLVTEAASLERGRRRQAS